MNSQIASEKKSHDLTALFDWLILLIIYMFNVAIIIFFLIDVLVRFEIAKNNFVLTLFFERQESLP